MLIKKLNLSVTKKSLINRDAVGGWGAFPLSGNLGGLHPKRRCRQIISVHQVGIAEWFPAVVEVFRLFGSKYHYFIVADDGTAFRFSIQ